MEGFKPPQLQPLESPGRFGCTRRTFVLGMMGFCALALARSASIPAPHTSDEPKIFSLLPPREIPNSIGTIAWDLLAGGSGMGEMFMAPSAMECLAKGVSPLYEQLTAICSELGLPFQTGISLQLSLNGLGTDLHSLPAASRFLAANGVPVASIDVPEITPGDILMDDISRTLERREIGRMLTYIARAVSNWGSDKEWVALARKLVTECPSIASGRRVVRASSFIFLYPRKLEALQQELKVHENMILLVELQPHTLKFHEFWEQMGGLAQEYNAFVSVDLSHWSNVLKGSGEDGTALGRFEQVMQDPKLAGLVAGVELSQINEVGDPHRVPWKGQIPFPKVLELYAEAWRRGHLPPLMNIIFEAHPRHRSEILRGGESLKQILLPLQGLEPLAQGVSAN